MPIIDVEQVTRQRDNTDKKAIINKNLSDENYKRSIREKAKPVKQSIRFKKSLNIKNELLEAKQQIKEQNHVNIDESIEVESIVKTFSTDLLALPIRKDKREIFGDRLKNSSIITNYMNDNIGMLSNLNIDKNYRFGAAYLYYFLKTNYE